MKWEYLLSALFSAFLLLLFAYLWTTREEWGSANTAQYNQDAVIPAATHEVFNQKDWMNVSRPLTANDLKGRILLLVFQNSSSLNFLHVLPRLEELYQDLKDQLSIVLVHSPSFANEAHPDTIRNFLILNRVDFPVVLDSDLQIWKAYGLKAWPTFVLLDPEGNIKQTLSGERDLSQVKNEIQQLAEQYEGQFQTRLLPYSLERLQAPSKRGPLSYPTQLAYTQDNDQRPMLIIADSGNHQVKGVRLDGSVVFSAGMAGKRGLMDGSIRYSKFNTPRGIIARDHYVYVADSGNHALRRIDFKDGVVETLLGTGKIGYLRSTSELRSRKKIALSSPWDLAFFPTERQITISMAGSDQLWTYHLGNKDVKLLLDQRSHLPSALARHLSHLYLLSAGNGKLNRVKQGKMESLFPNEAPLQYPQGISADSSGIYVTDTYNHLIRHYDPIRQESEILLGSDRGAQGGDFSKAQFNEPRGILKVGDKLYIADTNNHQIRVADLKTKKVSTLGVYDNRQKNLAPTRLQKKENQLEPLVNMESYPRILIEASETTTLSVIAQPQSTLHQVAPSHFTLYRKQADGELNTLLKLDREQLLQRDIVLPKVEKGATYRLRGSLYYCQKESEEGTSKSSPHCFVKSHDYTFLGADSGDRKINIYF